MVYPYTDGSPVPDGTELLHLSPDPALARAHLPGAARRGGRPSPDRSRRCSRSCAARADAGAARPTPSRPDGPAGRRTIAALEATARERYGAGADGPDGRAPTPWCGRCRRTWPSSTRPSPPASTSAASTTGPSPAATSSARAAGSAGACRRARRAPGLRRAGAGAVRRRRRLGHVLAAGAVDRGPRAAAGGVRGRQQPPVPDPQGLPAGHEGRDRRHGPLRRHGHRRPARRLRRPGVVAGRCRRRASTTPATSATPSRRRSPRAARTCSSSPSPRRHDRRASSRSGACGSSRDGRVILDDIDWEVREGERWVVLGRNGSGKTTHRADRVALPPPVGRRRSRCSASASAASTSATLRTRIGLASSALADQLRPALTALDVVMTAKHAALEPWWHRYDEADRERARDLLDRFGVGRPRRPDARHAVVGRAPAGAAGPHADDRARAGAARRADRRPRPRRPRGARGGPGRAGRATPTAPPAVLVTHHVDEIPPGFTHALLLRQGRVLAPGPLATTLDEANLSECFDLPLRLEERGGRFSAWAR